MENKELQAIKEELKEQNGIIRQMLLCMQKPEYKFTRILEIVVLIAGALGILHTFELVRNWIAGGL